MEHEADFSDWLDEEQLKLMAQRSADADILESEAFGKMVAAGALIEAKAKGYA